MTWISDAYANLKALWQRFEQWERLVLLREKEWRFPVYGTVEEFQRRFQFFVPQVPRDEFFDIRKRYKTRGISGFCMPDEVAVKVPNPRPSGVISSLFHGESSIYHFHGSFNRDRRGLYAYGHYRMSQVAARTFLNAINSPLFALLISLVVWALGYAAWLITGSVAGFFFAHSIIIFVPTLAPMFALGAISTCLFARLFEYLDRHARDDTHRLLAEICGSPAQPSTAHSE